MAARIKVLLQQEADYKTAAAAILAKAEAEANRALTVEEATTFDGLMAKIEALAPDIARERKAQEFELAQAVRETVQVGKNRAEDRECTFGEFLQGVAYMGHPKFGAAMVPDHVKAVLFAGPTGANSGVSSEGGFLVRTEWNETLMNKAQESSQLLGKVDSLPIGDGFDGLEAPFVDETSRATGSRWGGVRVYRAAEAAAVTASKPAVGRFELRLEDLKALFYATDRVLRDATLLQALAMKAFSSEFAFKIDDEILRGTGVGQCLGVLNSGALISVSKQVAQSADTIVAQNVIKMYNRMLAKNMGRAEWYINQECLEQLQQMYIAVGTAGGQLVYMPPSGLEAAPYGTLLGKRVNVLEQSAGLGDLGDILFLDLSEYLMISKGMTSAESAHVRFIYDEMTFKWTWPIIGKPKLTTAITPYKATTATTLSPFIGLEAR